VPERSYGCLFTFGERIHEIRYPFPVHRVGFPFLGEHVASAGFVY